MAHLERARLACRVPANGIGRLRRRARTRLRAPASAGRDPDADHAARRQELGDAALAHQAALVDDADDVGQLLDLGQEVAGDEDGLALPGEVAQRLAHGGDARRVEAVGGLVEQQQVGVVSRSAARCPAAASCPASSVADLVAGPVPSGRPARAPRRSRLRATGAPVAPQARAGSRGPTGTGRTTGVSMSAPTRKSRLRSRHDRTARRAARWCPRPGG